MTGSLELHLAMESLLLARLLSETIFALAHPPEPTGWVWQLSLSRLHCWSQFALVDRAWVLLEEQLLCPSVLA